MADEVKLKLVFSCLVEFLKLVTCFEKLGVLLPWHLKLRWPCMCKSICICKEESDKTAMLFSINHTSSISLSF